MIRLSSLKSRLLTLGMVLALFSVLGSALSLHWVHQVNQRMQGLKESYLPLSQDLGRIRMHTDLFLREVRKALALQRWDEVDVRVRPAPAWGFEILRSQLNGLDEAISHLPSAERDIQTAWRAEVMNQVKRIESLSETLYVTAQNKGISDARRFLPQFESATQGLAAQLNQAADDAELKVKSRFHLTDIDLSGLEVSLAAVLVVAGLISIALMGVANRILRPITEILPLVRGLADAGLKPISRSQLSFPLMDSPGEVGELAREFHRLVTQLMERDRMLKQQQDCLEDQNRRLAEMGALNDLVLRTLDAVILVVGPQNQVLQANPQAEKIFSDLGNWQQHPIAVSLVNCTSTVPIAVRTPNGESWLAQSLPLNFGAEVADNGRLLVFHNVSDRERLEERLRLAESLAAVGRLSAQIAHEIRNPLHSMGLEAELALENLEEGEFRRDLVRESLHSVLKGVERLQTITENYLKLSRPAVGEHKPFSIAEALESVLALYAPVAQVKGVELQWSFTDRAKGRGAEQGYLIYGDRPLLEQALGNLIKNAIQAVEWENDPFVRAVLDWKREGGFILAVEDNGLGVEIDVASKIFTPFVTTRAEGTGLGLPFVRKIVSELGGEVRLTQLKGPTRFEVSIPEGAV